MIIGAKRKEEVIRGKRWGFFNDGIREKNPIGLKVFKRYNGRWEIWEMISAEHGKAIAAFVTKKKALEEANKLGKRINLEVSLA